VVFSGKYFNNKPIDNKPTTIVIKSWLILPTIVEKIAEILFSFLRTKIRPTNSPTLKGVKIDIVIPERTAFKE